MTLAWQIFTCLTCAALTLCNAGKLPPPTNLSHKWLDPFTVTISWSWEQPHDLPNDCKTQFEIHGVDKELNEYVKRTEVRNLTNSCLTEEIDSDYWNYTIRTISNPRCEGWDDSLFVITTVHTAKPRAELVKDFKCNLDPKGMNCSWIPLNRSLNLTLSYRKCGESDELIKTLKECDRYYRHGMRDGCYLNVDDPYTCINAQTEAALSTFKPLLVVPSPNLTIKQVEKNLRLTWTPPEVAVNCDWIYELCFKRCNEQEDCKNITEKKAETNEPYDDNCFYEFRSRVTTGHYCPRVSSDFSEIQTYGSNKPPDETLTVAAIVIPIILSLCVMLSCLCFKRHRTILCPIIPDPSALFKEMMMNGNRELKPTEERVYTPVPESTEPCNIEKENSVPQQNS